jgi:ATP-dependent Clp protease ATP-binding subunit ClpA
LALLKYEASVFAQVAQAFGIDYHNVRKIAEANPLPPIDPQPKEEIDTEDRQSNTFSDACKRVMKYSREEAMRMGNNYIGTEHILQGIIREALRTSVTRLTPSASPPRAPRPIRPPRSAPRINRQSLSQ